MKKISAIILKILGWDISGNIPENVRKSVMIVAPHTSQMDFLIGRLACWKLNINAFFLIKKEMFFFPLGYILKGLGAVPVNRAKGGGIVSESMNIFNKHNRVTITITPEGTRHLTNQWKRGFYYISIKANVPIVLGYLNYRDKKGGVGEVFYPTGDFESDFKYIEQFYRKTAYAKYPDKFNLS